MTALVGPTAEERRWQQVHDRGTAALSAAILDDPELYPQADDHVAALDPEQREQLGSALQRVLDIVEGMRGAS